MGLFLFLAGIVVVWIVVSGLRNERVASDGRRRKIKESYPIREAPNDNLNADFAPAVVSRVEVNESARDAVVSIRRIERDPVVVVNPKSGAPLGEWLLVWHEKGWNRQLRLPIDRLVEQRILVRQVVSRNSAEVRGKLLPGMTDWTANFVDVQQVTDPETGEIFDPTLWFWCLVDFQKKLAKEKRAKHG